MIEQVMKSNILQEASNLLKKQNKENNNDKFDLSFKDLFLTKDNENLKSSNDINTIVITFEDDQDYLNENNKNLQSQEDYIENSNYFSRDDKINNVSVQKENQKSKNINKDQINKDLKNKESLDKESLKDNIKLEEGSNKRESLESINIKLKYRNLELKGDLDFKTKQKIKSIIHDLKSGKINTNIANAFISQIIRDSHINGLKSLNKNRKIKVQIKKDEDDKIRKLVTNKKEGSLDLEKNKNITKSNNKDENFNQFSSTDNKLKLKSDNKSKISDKEQIKNEDIKLKEFKSEIKLEFNDKNSNIALNKDVILNTKKVLETNKQALFQQVVKNTKVILAQNQTKFSTMIRPENLGRIDFQFIVKDGKMNGRVILQNQEVVDFFKSNIEELKAVMQKSNVEMENIEIILAGNRFGEFADQHHKNDYVSEDKFTYINKISSKNIETFEENNSLESVNYSKRDNSKINILI